MDRPYSCSPAPHLSTPLLRWLQANSPMRALDAVVIGSGYGGAVAALRLAQKGWRVTVLERGSEYRPGEFPNDLGVLPKHVRAPSPDGRAVTGRATGLFEWRVGPGALALVANGVGGGSLINAGVLFEPDPDVFAQEAWPSALRRDREAPQRSLAHYLAVARQMLQGHRFHEPGQPAPFAKTAALQRLAQAIEPGARAQPVDVTIDPAHCTRCGDCASGCNVPGAKRTLRDTYLAEAVHEHGVRVVSRATVYTLQPLTGDDTAPPGARWRLRVLPTERVHAHLSWQDCAEADGCNLDAALVVVAAGTFGSTELLQRSRDRAGAAFWLSGALGARFSANGDSLTFSTNENQPVNAVGVGADTWQTPPPAEGTVPDHGVGPCISAVIDLRRDPAQDTPRALEERLIIEEGAVPGAIGRLWAEGLATLYTLAQLDHWRFQAPRGALWQGERIVGQPDPLSVGDHLAADARTAAQSLPRRTQVLLTMGHDGSKGRIVWVRGRDASVPYWEAPQDLRTYQRQEDVLQAVRNNGATLLHAPNWQLLPGSARTTMSGPKPEPALTTVHPLGGCAMGDDPASSVVDHLGRVWANDDGDVHDGLYVLDGAIVPTALGVNPLLTITALAERAMDHLPARPALTDPGAHRPEALAHADPLYTAYARPQRPRFEVTMHERMVCPALTWPRPMGEPAVVSSDLQLTFEHDDWLAMWDAPLHAPRLRTGAASQLRLHRQATSNPGAMSNDQARYELLSSQTNLIAAIDHPALPLWVDDLPGPLGRAMRRVLSRLVVAARDFGRHPRAFATWLILRGHSEGSRTWLRELWAREGLGGLLRALASLLRQLHHASERRAMLYDMRFRLPAAGAGQSSHWPPELRLIGQKQVSYAATWPELLRWSARMLRRAVQPAESRGPRPLPRASYLEQSGNLHVKVYDAHSTRELARGRYDLDPHYWARSLNVRKGQYNFEHITYQLFKDNTAAFEAFKAGEFDLIQAFSAKEWARSYQGGKFNSGELIKREWQHGNAVGFQGFIFNTRLPKFADPRVRRAIGLAMDFEWMNRQLFYGAYTRLSGYFTNSDFEAKGLPGPDEMALLEPLRRQLQPQVFTEAVPASPSTAPPGSLRANLRQARDLLAQAGWTYRDGALRNARGEPFTIEFLDNSGGMGRVITPYIATLGKLGIQASYRVIDFALYEKRIKAFEFEMISSRVMGSTVPGSELRLHFDSHAAATPGSSNLGGVANPVVDALIDKVLSATNRPQLVAACRALDRVLRHGYYMVPHWYSPVHRVAYRAGRFEQPPVTPRYYQPESWVLDTWWSR